MDLPSTGWVTALAGLLARGSMPSCVRPSQAPEGPQWPYGRGLAAYSCGGSHGLTPIRNETNQTERAKSRVPSFVPGATRETSTINN